MQRTLSSEENSGLQERIADTVTAFCGNMLFVYIHIAAFAAWIATDGFGTDDFPFNFLTMAVSLEAIFLSTFVLISQNRQEAAAEERNEKIQESMVNMLKQVLKDEKLDQKNEAMIQDLLQRIDVDHLRPMRDKIDAMVAAVGRVEALVTPKAG
jgi:uncharacterized membrane protein